MRKWEKIVWRILVVISFLCIGSYLITGLICKKPTVFGVRPFFIVSESMEPTIKKYQLVIGVPVDAEDVEVGDIVAYQREATRMKKIVIHRLINIDSEMKFIFQGDNNSYEDDYVDSNEIKYKII